MELSDSFGDSELFSEASRKFIDLRKVKQYDFKNIKVKVDGELRGDLIPISEYDSIDGTRRKDFIPDELINCDEFIGFIKGYMGIPLEMDRFLDSYKQGQEIRKHSK